MIAAVLLTTLALIAMLVFAVCLGHMLRTGLRAWLVVTLLSLGVYGALVYAAIDAIGSI